MNVSIQLLSQIQLLSKSLYKFPLFSFNFVTMLFTKILILLVLLESFETRIVLSGTRNRAKKMRRRNMIVNMRPILDNEPIFGRVDVSKDMTINSESNSFKKSDLEELAHKIGQYLFGNDKKTITVRSVHNPNRKSQSIMQSEFTGNTQKDRLIDLENRIINPIYTAEEAWERHRRIKRN